MSVVSPPHPSYCFPSPSQVRVAIHRLLFRAQTFAARCPIGHFPEALYFYQKLSVVPCLHRKSHTSRPPSPCRAPARE